MVNAITHFAIGILIAAVFGIKGRRMWMVGWLAAFPDIDVVAEFFFSIIDGIFDLSHGTHNTLYLILGHREFLHSWLVIIFVTAAIAIWKKDKRFTIAGFLAIFSHWVLDFGTTWMTRPFWPFNDYFATLGVMDWADPITFIITVLVLYFFVVQEVTKRDRWKDRLMRSRKFLENRGMKAAWIVMIVFLSWCLILAPGLKAISLSRALGDEGDLTYSTYKNSHPLYFGVFTGAYSHNETHFRAVKFMYWSGAVRDKYVEKVTIEGDAPNSSKYVDRTWDLFKSKIPVEIDYPTYEVEEDEHYVNVTLSDARNSVVGNRVMVFFGPIYEFSFDKANGDFTAYIDRAYGAKEEVPRNWFKDL